MAGEAFMTFPPIVPLARVACDPTMAEASASPVKRSRTTACDSISSCVTRAPSRRPAPAEVMPRSASMPWMATSASGRGFLPWREPTTMSVPPATGRAPSARAFTASSTLLAAT